MKDHTLSSAFLALTLFFLSCNMTNAATLSLDLDNHTPGIQSSLTGLHGGSSTLVLTRFPFGFGTELGLAETPVPWLFASGMLALLGVGYRKGTTTASTKTASSLILLFTLALISPPGFSAPQDADIDGDAMVTSQDISLLASCFGQDPTSNSECAKSDVDEDGDIDGDDFSFVTARLGQAYPETLFNDGLQPLSFAVGALPNETALGDVNNDGVLDAVVANFNSDDISVLLGNGDGSFQAQQRYVVSIGDYPPLIALGDVNGDGELDLAGISSASLFVLLNNPNQQVRK